MTIHALNSLIRAQYAKLPKSSRPVALLISGFLALLFITLILKGCGHLIAHLNKFKPVPLMIRQGKKIIIPEHSPLRTALVINTVKSSSSPHMVSVPGFVEANPAHIVSILAPVTGHLIKLNVRLGQHVKPHQTLAIIRSPGLAQATSDKNKAQSLLQLTKEALKRAKSVNLAGGNTIKDMEIAQSNYIQAQAEFDRTKQTLQSMGKNGFSLLHIKTPIDGHITSLNYGKGSYITDPTAPLMTVSNLKSVWVTANIPENLAGKVSKNLPVEVFLIAYPNETLHGRVSFVSTSIDPDTHRNKTRIAFKNPNGKLQPNMYATVNIAIKEPNQIIVPISSILMNNDTTSVFVETLPWTFERHDVELGTEDGEQVRIIKGLQAGDRVVTNGGVFVND